MYVSVVARGHIKKNYPIWAVWLWGVSLLGNCKPLWNRCILSVPHQLLSVNLPSQILPSSLIISFHVSPSTVHIPIRRRYNPVIIPPWISRLHVSKATWRQLEQTAGITKMNFASVVYFLPIVKSQSTGEVKHTDANQHCLHIPRKHSTSIN